jgi:hypothetical protein
MIKLVPPMLVFLVAVIGAARSAELIVPTKAHHYAGQSVPTVRYPQDEQPKASTNHRGSLQTNDDAGPM